MSEHVGGAHALQHIVIDDHNDGLRRGTVHVGQRTPITLVPYSHNKKLPFEPALQHPSDIPPRVVNFEQTRRTWVVL
jgi:hypothetical protein